VDTEWTARRTAAVLVALWLGGMVMVALAAPASFWAVDSLMGWQPGLVADGTKKLGPVAMYELLRLQAGEANRQLFGLWGWIQVGLSAAVFILVLFFSNLKKMGVILAGGVLAAALIIGLVVIPGITTIGREVQISAAARAAGGQRFGSLHFAYSAFQLVAAGLGLGLLRLLLGGSRLTGRGGKG
jgi:predicted lysophospholipase L1 biosynthesis ABC-type transport system permease subunit